MSSDDYFEDELDSAFLNEVDAIEAAQISATNGRKPSPVELPPTRPVSPRSVIEISDSDPFDVFDFDVAELQDIHEREQRGSRAPGPSTLGRATSKTTVQTTLFGDIVQENATKGRSSKPPSKAHMERSNSSSRNPFGERTRKTKRWDHTAFAKTGWKQSAEDKAKRKAKAKASFDHDYGGGSEEEEPVEFEQFPAPFVPVG